VVVVTLGKLKGMLYCGSLAAKMLLRFELGLLRAAKLSLLPLLLLMPLRLLGLALPLASGRGGS
jgi:hypothetical protein